MSDSFTIQMNRLHDPDYEWDNVYPLNEWTLVDYKNMFKFISEGYLVQSDDNVGFVINEEWGCDPMWEVEMIKHIDETGKETIYTFDEFFDNGHYSSDTNEDNIEMINDWCDKHNVGGSCETDGEEDNCPHCGDDRGDHDISDRNRLIPCESDGEGEFELKQSWQGWELRW